MFFLFEIKIANATVDLIAEWRFDESSWNGTASEVKDVSGNDHHGKATSGTEATTADTSPASAGDPGTCDYGVFSSSTEGVEIAHHSDFNVSEATGFTISAWVYLDSIGTNQVIIQKNNVFELKVETAGNLEWTWDHGTERSLDSTINLSAATWYHIAVVVADDDRKIYIDGTQRGNDTTSRSEINTASNTIYIGQRTSGGADLSGRIDEVRIYGTTLTSDQVNAIKDETHVCDNNASSPSASNLVGEWRFEQSSYSGTTGELVDSGTNSLNGESYGTTHPTTTDTSPATAGNPGTCRYLEVDSSDTHMKVPDNNLLDFGDSDYYTITAWLKVDVSPSGTAATFVSKGDNYLLRVRTNDGLRYRVNDGTDQDLDSSTTLTTGTWYHVALVATPGTRTMYIDGNVEVRDIFTTTSVGENSGDLSFGAIPAGSGKLQGDLDEIRIYDAALTPSQINTVKDETHSCEDASVDSNDLLAAWYLDELRYTATSGEVTDSGTNSMSMTAVQSSGFPSTNFGNPADAGSDGTCGYGDFSGTSGTSLRVSDAAAMDVQTFTAAAWVYPDNFSSYRTIISKADNWEVHVNTSGNVEFWFDTGSANTVTSTGTLTAGQWNHVAVTWTTGSQIIYIDGTADATTGSVAGTLSTDSTYIYIGGDDTASRSWDGFIDEVYYYDVVMNGSQIGTIKDTTRTCSTGSTSDLLGAWYFEEESWNGTSGEVTDSSGNSYNGTTNGNTAVGSISPAHDGATGTCNYAVFDGSSDVIQDISLPNIKGNFTVTAWINTNDLTGVAAIAADDDNDNGFLFYRGANKLRVQIDGLTTDDEVETNAAVLTAGTWYHVAAVHDVHAKTVQIYVDGSAVTLDSGSATWTYTGDPTSNDSGNFAIGTETTASANHALLSFDGEIDEVRVYEAALSGSDISTIMTTYRSCSVSSTNLVGEWRMDEWNWDGTSGEVTDSGSNSLNMTATQSSGYPNTFNTDPANDGADGTCAYSEFNDTSGTYISVADPGASSVVDLGEFTITAWVKLDTGADIRFILGKNDAYEFYFRAGDILRLRWFESSSANNLDSTAALSENVWMHVTAVYSNGFQALYVDGVLNNSATNTHTIDQNNDVLMIGNESEDTTHTMKGKLDEVRLYNKALNRGQINTIMNETRTCAEDTSVLVANWRFDEWDYDGTSGEADDQTSNNLDLTATQSSGKPTTAPVNPAQTGDPGTCSYLDVGGTDSTWMTVSDAGSSWALDLSDEITITAWVYLSTNSELVNIYAKNNAYEFEISAAGNLRLWWRQDGSNTEVVTSTTSLSTGQWYHVAATYSVGSQEIFIDGVSDNTGSSSETIQTNNEAVTVGGDSGATGETLDGFIDEVRVYNRQLSKDQINLIMNDTHSCAGSTSDLLAEWRFDESSWNGTSNEVVDDSGNAHHGTASGGVTTSSSSPASGTTTGTCRYADFDGTDDYLDVSGVPNFYGNYTVTMWANFDSNVSFGRLMADDDNNTGWSLSYIDNYVNITTKGGTDNASSTPDTLSTSTWYHLAFVHDVFSKTRQVYIDGTAVALDGGGTSESYTGTITSDSGNLYIGDEGSGGENLPFDGRLDEVRIYRAVLGSSDIGTIKDTVRACPNWLDHFDFSISATASVCSPLSVTITAKDSGDSTITDYTGTITLSTSTNNGDWSKTETATDAEGTLTPGASDSGSATYAFHANDNGVITIELENSHAETLTVNANDTDASVDSTSSSTTFSSNEFEFVLSDTDVIAGRDHTITVNMIRVDSGTGKCSVSTDYSETGMKVYMTRSSDDPGGTAPTLTGTGSVTLPTSLPVSNNLTVPFSSGTANVTLGTSDVGQFTISMRDDSTNYSDTNIDGTSSAITVRPFGFYIDVTSNPAATSAAGAVFTTAGTNFTVSVSAVGWETGDDSNADGVPDDHSDSDPSNNADLSNNSVLAAFGQETTPEEVQLTATLIDPSGGTDGGLADGDAGAGDGRVLDSFSSGSDSSSNVYFAEVGIIEIKAEVNDGNYLGIGTTNTDKMESKSGYVGRFYPADFAISGASITEACTPAMDYSYMGETFTTSYTLTARNSLGATTTNYESDFAKLKSSYGSISYTAIDANTPTVLTSRLSGSSQSYSWTSGVGTLGANLVLARTTSPDGPYDQLNVGVIPSDSDSVALQSSDLDLDADNNMSNESATLGQGEVRYGRLVLANAFGPETANLPVNFSTEYWNGSTWVSNTDDSCTAIATSAITYPDGTIDVVGNRTATVGGGTTTGTYSSISSGNVNFSSGDAGHYFTAPGSGNTGSISVDVSLSSYSWLQFDWNGDGNYTDTALPTANYNFGTYRGHDRVLYWREVLE